MAKDDPTTTQELRLDQQRRVGGEHEAARDADTEAEERAHRRRAERAAYLADRLAERERSEREA